MVFMLMVSCGVILGRCGNAGGNFVVAIYTNYSKRLDLENTDLF